MDDDDDGDSEFLARILMLIKTPGHNGLSLFKRCCHKTNILTIVTFAATRLLVQTVSA